MQIRPKKVIILAIINGFKLPNLVIILLTNGDNTRNITVNGSNIIEAVNAFPPKPSGIDVLTSTGIV
jgi:hypothetical protein